MTALSCSSVVLVAARSRDGTIGFVVLIVAVAAAEVVAVMLLIGFSTLLRVWRTFTTSPVGSLLLIVLN
ncbi:unnamed protein product [Brugia timori]|uniref:Uncharacterized protein n=1 Tax=Brugia timori TaxID=42155 RepID=A0A3P7SMS7_9BILA|nr:unnamed protein product [Brugia timori]